MADAPDSLVTGLAGLALEAPPGLRLRVLDALELVEEFVLVPSPAGPVFVVFGRDGVVEVDLAAPLDSEPERFAASYLERTGRIARLAMRPPAGLRRALQDGNGRALAFDLRRSSPFERAVLGAALEIPRGEIRSYSWIAQRIDRPRAVRAVGSALGRNPVPILIPCHRVVRSDGRIGEYAFGSELKRSLLTHEAVDLVALEALSRAGIRLVGSATTAIYCLPSCQSLRRVRAENRVEFHRKAEAEAAGFRPCLQCRPTAAASVRR